MQRSRWDVKICAVAICIAVLCWSGTKVWADDLLVSAAASLADALKEIGSSYQVKTQQAVRFNFGPSSGLARQILQGAPVDLFFSADSIQMDRLEGKGHLEPGTRTDLLSNQLVVIVPRNSKILIGTPQDLAKPEVRRIALAEPTSVPVGVYTSEYLLGKGLWEKIRTKIVPVQDVRATLVAVESGNVEAGFVYKTDAAVSNQVKVAYEVPIAEGPKIKYPAAVIRDSRRTAVARQFLNHLQTTEMRETFKRHGFIVLD